jgi:hypothetical protein
LIIASVLLVQAAKAIPERFSQRSEKFFGVGVGVGEGFGAGVETFTPLPQTSFFPDFTQVYLSPLNVEVRFNLEQDSPALTTANAGTESIDVKSERHSKNNVIFLILLLSR